MIWPCTAAARRCTEKVTIAMALLCYGYYAVVAMVKSCVGES
jgi:hypothetical protein